MFVKRPTTTEVMARVRKKIAEKKPVFVGACGMGIVAKCLEMAGADFICTFSGSVLRADGNGTAAQWFPVLDSNQQMMENTARHILPALKGSAAVLACVVANDPTRDTRLVLEYLKQIGVVAVCHSPSIGYFDKGSTVRKCLEQAGITMENEVEMLRVAKEMGLLTFGMPFDLEDTELIMRGSMPDFLCFHAGSTKGGLVGFETPYTVEETAERTEAANQLALKIKPDVILLAHGAALETPTEAQAILDTTSCHGIWTGSATDRIPIERAILEAAGQFAALEAGRGRRASP